MELQFKPATNLDEAANNFTNLKDLNKSTAEFYVDLYQDKKNELINNLCLPAARDLTILISGQVETGKTTFLNFLLEDEEIKNLYIIKNIDVDKYVSILSDNIDIYDVCFALAIELATEIKNEYNDDSLHKIIINKLQNFYNNDNEKSTFCKQENIPEETINSIIKNFEKKIGVNVDFFGRLFFKNQFKNSEKEFENHFNDIVQKYKEIRTKNEPNKDILIVIDQLEKNVNPTAIQNIFGNIKLLNIIPLKKIIVSPIYATLLNVPLDANVLSLNIIQKKNPSDEEKNRYISHQNLLKEIFKKRISPTFKILENEELLDKIIFYSGGNIGQFMKIVYKSIIQSVTRLKESNQIIEVDVNKALTSILSPIAMFCTFNGFTKDFLKNLDNSKEDFDKEKFLVEADEKDKLRFNKHLINNFFIVNNGQNPIYFVNPILKPYIYGVDGWDIK